MSKTLKVRVIDGGDYTVPYGTTLLELSEKLKDKFETPILAAKLNNELKELHSKITEDCEIAFLDVTDPNGLRVYQRTATFILVCAIKELLGKKTRVVVEHSINKNYYCEIYDDKLKINKEFVEKVENRMKKIIEASFPIEKISMPLDEAIGLCREVGLEDKVSYLRFRRTSNVNLYRVNWFYDYFYGQMAPDTGRIFNFKLIKQLNGMLLQFPSSKDPSKLAAKKSLKNIQRVFAESSEWNRILNVETIASLNNTICSGGAGNFIRVNEALHEKRIAGIADRISGENRTIVLIAGPSSSGKTTFAERLCIQLRVNGLRPHVISLDNYYLDREKTPLDEFGNYDFESIMALDLPKINQDLLELTEGKTVEIPHFNFKTGKREYKKNFLTLREDSVLVIEGIHGLNERLTKSISRDKKFKIFISALTQLNIDDHNRIATTDTRLIRRMLRDNQFRGFAADTTISMWPSVLRGEIQNIFPFQEEADAVFNSSLVYEMCVMKQYAEPLLFSIPHSEAQYAEAKRLIKFLDGFLPVNSELVPNNSILREFIGGSCFEH